MKPVVSSLVALVIAIAPLSAMAKPAHPHKSHHGKIAKSKDKSEKAEKEEQKSEKSPIVRVKASKKDGIIVKNVVHHAHNVDLGGAGHKEPKSDHGGLLVAASLRTPSHGKASPTSSKSTKSIEMSKREAGKPSKGGARAEGGARKPAEKKADADDDSSGEPARDEELADLVARIRGQKTGARESEELADLVARIRGQKTSGREEVTELRETIEAIKGDGKAAKHVAHRTPVAPCSKDPVEIIRGPEVERFALTKCDGSVAPLAIEHLSILIRPGGAARPIAPLADLAKKPGSELAHGIKRVDARLIDRIQSVVDHFGKPGEPAKLSVISGYRPASVGSMHSSGRAIDFRVEGTKNEDVVAFCKTLADTGCGFYPNSSFVHIDVRDTGAGHVTWIDASGPGETPRYVSQWPAKGAESSLLRTISAKTEPSRTTEELAAEGETILRAQRPSEHETETVDEHTTEKRDE